jgi:P-type Ca2+ transporter type 2C
LVFEAEREEDGVMRRPPRPADEPLFSWPTVIWSLLQGIMVLGVAGSAAWFAPSYGLDPDQVRGLTFSTLVLGVVALILIDRSNSNSILSALLRPNKALAVVLPIVASLLAVTLFWAPARDLFGFGVLEGVWLAVPPLAGIGVLLALEVLKPLWRMVLSAHESADSSAVKLNAAQ